MSNAGKKKKPVLRSAAAPGKLLEDALTTVLTESARLRDDLDTAKRELAASRSENALLRTYAAGVHIWAQRLAKDTVGMREAAVKAIVECSTVCDAAVANIDPIPAAVPVASPDTAVVDLN
jgi:hypothetical protein